MIHSKFSSAEITSSDSILLESKVKLKENRGMPKKTRLNHFTWITNFGLQANKLNCFFFGFNHELAPAATTNQFNEMHFTKILIFVSCLLSSAPHLLSVLLSIEQFPFQWLKYGMKIVCMPTIQTHTLVVPRPVQAHFLFSFFSFVQISKEQWLNSFIVIRHPSIVFSMHA